MSKHRFTYAEINDAFVNACQTGDLNKIKELNALFKPPRESDNKFIRLAQKLFRRVFKDTAILDVHYYDDRCFRYACDSGHVEVVEYLLTSAELVEKCNLQVEDNYGFRMACMRGHLALVKFFLTSAEMPSHELMEFDEYIGFRLACEKRNLPLVKYLLTSPELEQHAQIHAHSDDAFKWACHYKDLAMLNFFIFTMNIARTDHISNYLNSHPDEEVERLFQMRELNKNLTEALVVRSEKGKRNKI